MTVNSNSASPTLTIVSTMTPERFADWLRGFLDACGDKPTQKQVEEIRKKLGTVAAPYQQPAPIYVYPTAPIDPSRWTQPLLPAQPPWPYYEPYTIWCGTDYATEQGLRKTSCATNDLTAFTGTAGINWNPGNVQ